MIKRNIPKKLIPVENLTEGLTVGASGIDVTSPPTKSNTVYDMENLDVALDNSLSLRKPLLYNHKVNDISKGSVVEYMFDDKELEIFTGDVPTIGYVNIDDFADIKYPNVYINLDDPTDTIDANEVFFRRPYGLHIHEYGDLDIVNDLGQIIPLSAISVDVEHLQVINTNTSSIIFGFRFNLSNPVLKHYAKATDLKSGDVVKYRPIKITKEDGVYKAEVLQIEVPTLYVDSASNVTRVYFNMMDDYTYSFRDNYDAGYTYCNGVIAYTPKDNTLTSENIMGYSVEELTESDKFIIVDSLTRDEVSKKFILKAFCTHTFTETPGYSVYCTWEKSYDNVTWNPVQEFLDSPLASNIVYLDVKDDTKSYETLEQAYKYTRKVPYIPFNINNNQDVVGNRPDVLVLNGMDSAMYRFTIRSVAVPTVGEKIVLSHTITPVAGFVDLGDTQNYIAVDNNRQATFKIALNYVIEGNALSEAQDRIRVLVRSVYASDAGDSPTSAKRAFGDSLSDVALGGALELDCSYNKTNNTTVLTKELTVPITLETGWIAQRMCLKIMLFDNNTQTSEETALCVDTFDAIVGFNNTGDVVSNPLFKYLAYDNLEHVVSNKANIYLENPTNESFCYEMKHWQNGWDIQDIFTVNENNKYSLNFTVEIYESLTKTRIPISKIIELTHAFSTTPKVYNFTEYEYLLRNITLKFTIYLDNLQVCYSWRVMPFNVIDEEYAICSASMRLPVEITLCDFLQLKNNPTFFTNAISASINAKKYKGVIKNTSPVYKYNHDRFWGGWDATDKSIDLTESDDLFAFGIAHIYEDLASKIATASTNANVALDANVIFKYAPLVNTVKSYSLNSINVALTSSEYVFRYTDNEWKYSLSNNVLRLTDTLSNKLLNTTTTPESYRAFVPQFNRYESVYINPFKYITWYDISSTPIQSVLKIGDTVNLKTIYEALISTDDSVKYNVQYEVIRTSEYPSLDKTVTNIERYSLELASTPYTALFTNVKQINDYRPINIYSSNKIYYNHRVWFYGRDLKNNIYFSNADSSTVPMDNSLTLSTDMDDFVTALVPWKDYLVALTKNKIFLINKYSDSYVFKQVNTFVGTPEIDGNTCKAILNGVIFKSGTKVFVLHPNMYSSDDTILNITDISKPIAHHLIEGTNNFAIATEYEYFLFIPRTEDTLVFKYEYSRKVWSKFTYPVVLEKAKLFSVGDIQVIDSNNIVYDFDKTLEWFKTKHGKEMLEYGDYLNDTLTNTAISFYLDTGQKSSNIQNTKQFTESKFIIATMDVKDTFPIQTAIYVDGISLVASHKYMAGNLQLITTDASTDGAFSKTNPEDIAYLNTNIVTDNSDILNVMRQMILRYMGKGKTIRHVLKGNSTFNFKIYVLYYRYRMPHNKQ